jgi:hypothetical protein
MRRTSRGMKRLIGGIYVALGLLLCVAFVPTVLDGSGLPGRAITAWLGLVIGVGGVIVGGQVLWKNR